MWQERTSHLTHLGPNRWDERGEKKGGRKKGLEREASPYLYISRLSNRWFSREQETKSIPVARDTRGYRKRGVLKNSKR